MEHPPRRIVTGGERGYHANAPRRGCHGARERVGAHQRGRHDVCDGECDWRVWILWSIREKILIGYPAVSQEDSATVRRTWSDSPPDTMSHAVCSSVSITTTCRSSNAGKRNTKRRSAVVVKSSKRTNGDTSDDNNDVPTHSRRRVGLASCIVSVMAASTASGVSTPLPADAFGGEIGLSDLSYTETKCPPNQYVPNKKNTVCLTFTATATNNLKREVEAANIFGFVEDKQGNSAVTVNPTGTSRTVLAGLDEPIPSGTSTVKFVVTVFKDSLDLGPLKLKGFKAEPSRSNLEKRFKPFDECDLDPYQEGCVGAF